MGTVNESSCPGSPPAVDSKSRGPLPGPKALGLPEGVACPSRGVGLALKHKFCGSTPPECHQQGPMTRESWLTGVCPQEGDNPSVGRGGAHETEPHAQITLGNNPEKRPAQSRMEAVDGKKSRTAEPVRLEESKIMALMMWEDQIKSRGVVRGG